ncbi:MAG: VOC family protein [bacterium]
MNISHSFIQLATSDVPRLYGFYKHVVGLPDREDMGPDSFALGADTTFSIVDHSDISGPTKEPARFILDLWVDDLDAEQSRLKAAGVNFSREKGFEHWGGFISTFADPDGNLVQVIQYKPELAQAPQETLATA